MKCVHKYHILSEIIQPPRPPFLQRPSSPPSHTRHSHGARLIRIAPDPQLPVGVAPPALDRPTRFDGAGVAEPQGDGGCGDTCHDEGGLSGQGKVVWRAGAGGDGEPR